MLPRKNLGEGGNFNPLHPIAAKCAREISCPLHPIAAKCARTSLPLFIAIAVPHGCFYADIKSVIRIVP